MRRVLKWVVWPIGLLAVTWIVAVVATLRSGDARLYPPPAEQPRVEVFIAANIHHSGIILPRQALADAAAKRTLPALAAVTTRFAGYERLEFGWGDEGFYTRVPTTAEFTTALALRALFRPGNPSVLHVVGLAVHPQVAYPNASMVALTLGEGGFGRLAAMLDATFARSGRDGTIEEMGPGLYGPSLFFRAVGTSTCSGCAITGPPICSTRPASPPRRYWQPCRKVCYGICPRVPGQSRCSRRARNECVLFIRWPISNSPLPAGITTARGR
jgi:hypothetical protein